MEYDKKNLVVNFARRTKLNLDFIEENASKNGPYEVTQLINSCLGMLVFPRQKSIKNLPQTTLNDLEENGWPIPTILINSAQIVDFQALIDNMRHAIAHYYIKFESINGEISSLSMWNRKSHNKPINWKVKFTIEELKKFVSRFLDFIIQNKEIFRSKDQEQ